MSYRFLQSCRLLLPAAGVLLLARPAFADWTNNASYGGGMATDIFVPDGAASPPVVVALHFCGGDKSNAHGWFESYASMYGFIIIAPKAGGSCFDAGLGRSGERAEVVAMVDYVVSEYVANADRVFAAGASSGACMTQALLASYPELFKAGSSLAGVPAGAWTGGNAYGWSTPDQSAEQWGDKVRQVNPSFMGPWPRIQLWHGTGDTILTYQQNYPAQVAQWTNVWGVTDANATSETLQPMGATQGWDRTSYQDPSGTVGVEANSNGAAHDLTGSGLWRDVVRFFGLDVPVAPTTTDGSGGTTSTSGDGAGGASSSTGIMVDGTSSSTGSLGGNTGAATGAMSSSTGADSTSASNSATTGAPITTTGAVGAGTTGSVMNTASSAATTATATATATSSIPDGNSTTTGVLPATSVDEGGCSCRTTPLGAGGHSALALGLMFLGLHFKRRRRSGAAHLANAYVPRWKAARSPNLGSSSLGTNTVTTKSRWTLAR